MTHAILLLIVILLFLVLVEEVFLNTNTIALEFDLSDIHFLPLQTSGHVGINKAASLMNMDIIYGTRSIIFVFTLS